MIGTNERNRQQDHLTTAYVRSDLIAFVRKT
ncbi:hypothetical protein J2Z70_004367 [Paenibacillus silagei]|uniref:Uncharacterized protein n=1 Tax=Paenibacillus silagei TaxID=1670801 RepID=A0ABS4NVX7_9BACL|nr:hypothetical protein [Paenibacillus silagei]